MHLRQLLPLLACVVSSLHAQDTLWQRIETIGGDADDRRRLAQLLGERSASDYLLRSPSSLAPPRAAPDRRLRWRVVTPEIVAVGNSSIPFSLNDGPLWAGRGWSQDLRFGFRAQRGPVVLVVAPEFVATENLSYDLPPLQVQLPRPPGRDPLSTPWYVGYYSIDLPLRFGTWGARRLDPGQSTLAADLGAVTVGLSTENEWWGPGIRNAIVLSNNAAGIPRAFVRTTRPVRTRIGVLEARWFLGGLIESPYFDRTPADDRRAITALAATWTPAGASDLTLGFTRAVYAPLARWGNIFAHVLDVVRDRGLHEVPGRDGLQPRRDQIFSVFGRWVFPADGFAVHAEWARTDPPRSLRELLTAPNHSQGYTLGLEWARRLGVNGSFRLQAEATYLELPPSYRNQAEATFYTGLATPQGYTQRGEVIGAAIGPGASSQWLGLDYFRPRWRLGLAAGRIRWNDDALYLFPITAIAGNKWCSHDVSLFWSASAAADSRWGRFRVAVTRGYRLNVFFANLTTCDLHPDPQYIRDARNTTLEIRFSPP
jgi:hypothetical protein